MSISLSNSPFKAKYYDNYTFYVCPTGAPVDPIGCLINSENITVATREPSGKFMRDYGCEGIGSWVIPVSTPGQFDEGGESYLVPSLILTWDETTCSDCAESGNDESGDHDDKGAKPIANLIAIAMSMPAIIIMSLTCCTIFCLHVMRMVRDKHQDDVSAAAAATTTTTTAALPPPSSTSNPGLNESKIMECTEIVVVSESDENIPSGNSNTCSICLENYCKKETVRLITKCGHCFHAICIQQWLEKNSTCPVCRISLSETPL